MLDSDPHSGRRRRRRRLSRSLTRCSSSSLSFYFFSIYFFVKCFSGVHALAPVPLTPNFRFDGTHSDFAQQFYLRWLAGDSVPHIQGVTADDLPAEIDAALNRANLKWHELPGLLQRAVLWDRGYAIALDGSLTRIYTRCGRSMAEIFVSRKAYERIGCTPMPCSLPTGEVFYRHKWCDGDQAAKISLCASEHAEIQLHSGLWADGADSDFIPEVNLVRHAWPDHGDEYELYALHSKVDDVAYGLCPAQPSPVIPCASYDREPDKSRWCPPVPGKIVTPWLENFADAKRPKNGWIMIEVLFVMMLIGSTVYGTCDHMQNRKRRFIRRRELRDLRRIRDRERARHGEGRAFFGSDSEEEDEEERQAQLEKALDEAASEYFDSSIGIATSAHAPTLSASTRSTSSVNVVAHGGSLSGESVRGSSSLRGSGNRSGSTSRGSSLVHTGSRSGSGSQGGSFGDPLDGNGYRGRGRGRLERSVSTSSAISLLSGRRSQVAIRSFHLFQSHRLITQKRVPFREIQFNCLLSQGTTGEVWHATLRGQDVAVKQLLPTKRRVLKEMELFMAEIYLLSQLVHPNIVSLVGVAWNTLEHVVMVQEWMERGDLQRFLRRQRVKRRERHRLAGLPELEDDVMSRVSLTSRVEDDDDDVVDEAFTWYKYKIMVAQSVARALAHLHSLSPQLLHRDVKSKNVLLSAAMEVKLCDFGIARRKNHMDEDESSLTITEAAGTMSWTAPEVLMGDEYDEKVDIYSLGILLCEVDTCELPYHDAASLASRLICHPLRLMKLVVQEGLRPALSPECPPRVAALIRRCLDADPTLRPSAYEVVEELCADDVV